MKTTVKSKSSKVKTQGARVGKVKLPKGRKSPALASEVGTSKKGQSAVVKDAARLLTSAATGEIRMLLRRDVRPDPDQPRKVFDKAKLQGLADSIQAVGIAQPIQVCRAPGDWFVDEVLTHSKTPKRWYAVLNRDLIKDGKLEGGFGPEYETRAEAQENCPPWIIVDGERRWRAAEVAGVERIPVMVVDTSSPEWEKRKLAIQVVLNQQHENLSALEEAAAYGKEIREGRHTAESLYKALGISRGTLFGRLALNRLSGPVRAALVSGRDKCECGGAGGDGAGGEAASGVPGGSEGEELAGGVELSGSAGAAGEGVHEGAGKGAV
jgi:hypothetical protein